MKLLLSATLTSVVACGIKIGNRREKEAYCGAERLITSPEVMAGGIVNLTSGRTVGQVREDIRGSLLLRPTYCLN